MNDFLETIRHYYVKAKRTIILLQDNQSKQWFHVFSVIEILPDDIPEYSIPKKDWHNGNIIRSVSASNKNIYSTYLMVQDLPLISEALLLFNDPINNEKSEINKINYFNTVFIKEPNGDFALILRPNLHSIDGLASVLPKRNSGLYVWTKVDSERKTENIINNFEDLRNSISEISEKWLGFDLILKPEHIGNIYLVLPNPYFRDLSLTLSANPPGIFYNIKLRKDVNENFKIRILDTHGDNIALDNVFSVKNSRGLIELPHEPYLTELRAYNSKNDLIFADEPAYFIKQINFQMNIKHANLNVKIEDGDNTNEFTVEKYFQSGESKIGENKDFIIENFFANAEKKREYIKLEQNKEFIFFPGGKTLEERKRFKTQARNNIREIINQSYEICYLCDPYFNVKDLIEYILYIQNSSLEIKILNSKDSISKIEGKKLFDAIKQYNSKQFQKIECRVLKGNSILHDRFIISDKNVWYIGSSFNEFGNRATCLAKIPDSSGILIIKEIENWYYDNNQTDSLENYIK